MTLIAGFQYQDVPLLLGDFMISGGARGYTLKKVHLISPNLVVGWTGHLFLAKSLLRDLHNKFNGVRVSKEELEQFLINYPVDNSSSMLVHLVGSIIDDKRYCFLWNSSHPQRLFYESYHVDGSGATVFENMLKSRGRLGIQGARTSNVDQAIYFALTQATSGQTKVDTFNSVTKSVPLQLIEVAQRFNIPMGIEWSDESEDKGSSQVQMRDITVGSLLSQILARQPGYEYRLDDGVVHVFATRLLDDKYNFLNIRLREFSLEKANMAAARFHLWGAMVSHLHPRGGYGGGYGGVSIYKDFNASNITFDCKDLTVRQALSKIVEAQGNALWVVRIRERQMMESEPFYVQIPGPEAGEPSNNFAWQFIALDVHRIQ